MKNKGFTLVELLAVIAILAILVIIALPNVLKMFNDAKKNSFLTEAKTVYNNASNKYITESLKGNKLDHISSNDNTKLDMTGKDLDYYISLNDDGSVKAMKVYNGTYYVELKEGEKITDLKSTNIEEKQSDYVFEYSIIAKPISFEKDSWSTIKAYAEKCINDDSSCPYEVGNTKTIYMGDKYKEHTLRIANLSKPSDCDGAKFSQTACGFVIEFVDVIDNHVMNPTGEYNGKTYQYGWNKDGWPSSAMYKFLNDESDSSSIINALPNELKSVIIDTKTISGRGSEDTVEYFTSTDKLYLLATAEIWEQGAFKPINYDTARNNTRQLDFYEGVTTIGYGKAMKKAGTASNWWLRSSYSDGNYKFYFVNINGEWHYSDAFSTLGVSPAFRIG